MDDLAFLTEDFEANVDLTPLVDVVFMLLLFFILAGKRLPKFGRPRIANRFHFVPAL